MDTTQHQYAIAAQSVARSYGPLQALAGVDLKVPSGEIVAILGPNGAGKTTLIEILEGLRHRDGGTVSVLGIDPAHASPGWRARIGAVLQTESQSDELTIGETLTAFATYYPAPANVDAIAARLGLSDLLDRRIGRLSGGQRRRLDIALGIIGNPELLFLDEPTTGLDAEIRRDIWELIRTLAADGTTVVLTTHYLEEVEQLADSVVVMSSGRVVMTGTAAEIRGGSSTATVGFTLPDGVYPSDLPGSLPGKLIASKDGVTNYETADSTAFVRSLMAWAGSREVSIVEISQPSLEDAYLALISTNSGKDQS